MKIIEFGLKIMNIGLKWVHMARYELILRLVGVLWLTIIFKPLLTPKKQRFAEKEVRRFRFEPPDLPDHYDEYFLTN